MNRERRQFGAAVLGLAAASSLVRADVPRTSTMVPALTLAALDGTRHALVGGPARRRVVNLWARWCAPCRRELPSLQRLAERLDPQRIELLTIAYDDDLFALREYVRDIGFRRPVLPVAQRSLPPALQASSLPQTLALAPDGRVLARVIGARDWDVASASDALLQPDASGR